MPPFFNHPGLRPPLHGGELSVTADEEEPIPLRGGVAAGRGGKMKEICMSYTETNSKAWDAWGENGRPWTIPIPHEEFMRAVKP